MKAVHDNISDKVSPATPTLIVSDVDGTLITSSELITARLHRAIEKFVHSGGHFAIATGRPPRWVIDVVEQLPISPLCVCSNGAVVWDSSTDTFLYTSCITPDTMRYVAERAKEALKDHGGVSFGVERSGVSAYDPEDALFEVAEDFVHAWDSTEHGVSSEEKLLATPAMKMILRNPGLDSATMFQLVAPRIDPKIAHITYSMPEGLLEVSAPGVDKSTGVQFLADYLQVDQEGVVAFGDMPNDCEMLSWAGVGVAMGNAAPTVKNLADIVTETNNNYGVARVIEALQ